MKTFYLHFSLLTAFFLLFAMPALIAVNPPSYAGHGHSPDVITDLCIPWLDCSYGDGLESFAIADIDNYFSGCSDEGYGDFTWMNTELTAGQTYNLFAETGYDGNFLCVWIDYNDDYIFTPDEMLVNDVYLEFGAQLYQIEVEIPEDALPGEHLMRARAIWDESASDPCQGDLYGETEDYYVMISAGGISDIGIVSIDIPPVVSPGPVAVKVTVENFGTETYTQQLSIVNGVDYGTSAFVNDMLPGETRQVAFGDWDAQEGTYTFHAYLSYPDGNPYNDQLFKEVLVEIPNVAPPQDLDAGAEGNTVLLNWDAPGNPGVLCYHVYNNGTRVGDSIPGTEFTDLCLLSGEYTYTVTAVYAIGESVPCDPVSVSINLMEYKHISEDFEIYSTELQLVEQSPALGIDYWECYSQPPGSPEDPEITDDQFYEGEQAMIIQEMNDVVMHLGGKTEGKYQVAFSIYVPSGYDGFFGIWREMVSVSYGLEVYFNEDETGYGIVANSDWQSFTYQPDSWISIKAVIDLDNDWAKLYIDDEVLCQSQWSLGQYGEPGPLMLDIIDFYAGTLWGGTPLSYVDNISFKQIIDGPPHTISLQSGWSGISSYLMPVDQDVETLLQDIIPDMVILQDAPGIFWPAQNINTMNTWQPEKGYIIKMQNTTELLIHGPEVENKILELETGWNMMPVLCDEVLNVAGLFSGQDVLLVKEVAGSRVFWPAYGINTLELVYPGSAYCVMMNAPGSVEFPWNIYKSSADTSSPTKETDFVATPYTHTVAIPASVIPAELWGRKLAAFDSSGNCFGSTVLSGQNVSLTLIGDDPLTSEKEGFAEGETIIFKSADQIDMSDEIIRIEFKEAFVANDGRFYADGISAVSHIKSVQNGMDEMPANQVLVFPNPANSVVNIRVENSFAEHWHYAIGDLHGQVVSTGNHSGASCSLDVSVLPAGLYVISIEFPNQKIRRKLLIE
jgi:hypothetical protein